VRAGLEIAGVAADEAVLIGDDPEADAGAAAAAGVRSILLDRAAGEELPSEP
jgi:FMN phosphatase YigB (HAD superfamily)